MGEKRERERPGKGKTERQGLNLAMMRHSREEYYCVDWPLVEKESEGWRGNR